jgi:hypothetical protein
MVVLQDFIYPLKVEPGSRSEVCPVSSHGESQRIDVKEEDPEPIITFPVIMSENEVSCVCVCVFCWAHFTDTQNYVLSFHVKQLYSAE